MKKFLFILSIGVISVTCSPNRYSYNFDYYSIKDHSFVNSSSKETDSNKLDEERIAKLIQDRIGNAVPSMAVGGEVLGTGGQVFRAPATATDDVFDQVPVGDQIARLVVAPSIELDVGRRLENVAVACRTPPPESFCPQLGQLSLVSAT